MMPSSNRDIMNSVGSKYAVVVGISKKARIMSEKKELEPQEGCLANMVNHTVQDLVGKKLMIQHEKPETDLDAQEINEWAEENETDTDEDVLETEEPEDETQSQV